MTRAERIGTVFCCYLLDGGHGTVLVDTGPAAMRGQVIRRVRGRDVRLIVLTHGHGDHVANAAHLAALLGAKIAMHPADVPLLTDIRARPIITPGMAGRMMMWASDRMGGRSAGETFVPDIGLAEGMTLDAYGVRADVWSLPGHTEGSIGLCIDGGERLVVGDAMMHMGGGLAPKLYEDEAAMRRSMERIRASGARIVHVGHGPAVRQ